MFFDDQIQFDLNGKIFPCAYMDALPFIDTFENPDTGATFLAGAEIESMKLIGKDLNFKYDIIRSIDNQWGMLDPKTNNWTGLVGMALRKVFY